MNMSDIFVSSFNGTRRLANPLKNTHISPLQAAFKSLWVVWERFGGSKLLICCYNINCTSGKEI
jgi:hypothetical protein